MHKFVNFFQEEGWDVIDKGCHISYITVKVRFGGYFVPTTSLSCLWF